MIRTILEILNKILDFLGYAIEKKEERDAAKENQQAQENHDAIERDPVDFLNQHFGGVHKEAAKSASPTSSEAKD